MLSRYRVMECGSSYRIRERHKAVRRTAFQAAAAKLMFSMLFVASVVYAERHEYSRPLMGMAFRIIVYSEDEAKAKRAAKAAFDRVAVLNQIMSDYEPKSELSKLSNLAGSGKAAKISEELCSVLDRAQALAAQTGGAFDVTAGASVQLWRRARRVKQLPPQYALAKALKTVGFRGLNLDSKKLHRRTHQAGDAPRPRWHRQGLTRWTRRWRF